MQIVIDIPEEIYKARQHWVANPKRMIDEVDIAIANGTPLPKGHGTLKDTDALCDYFWDNRSKLYTHKDLQIVIDNAPIIIEAERESED